MLEKPGMRKNPAVNGSGMVVRTPPTWRIGPSERIQPARPTTISAPDAPHRRKSRPAARHIRTESHDEGAVDGSGAAGRLRIVMRPITPSGTARNPGQKPWAPAPPGQMPAQALSRETFT